MSRVRIPPVLRDVVGGSRELIADGSTVAAVLDELFGEQPALRDRICEDGRLSSFVNVYVNDTDIRHRDGLDTKVSADDVVILLPAMAGGCGLAIEPPPAALDRCDTVAAMIELKARTGRDECICRRRGEPRRDHGWCATRSTRQGA